MAEVFVDTAAWLALINTSDSLHDPARRTMARLRSARTRLTTTEFILLEVADALCDASVRSQAIRFLDGLRRLPLHRLLVPGERAAQG